MLLCFSIRKELGKIIHIQLSSDCTNSNRVELCESGRDERTPAA